MRVFKTFTFFVVLGLVQACSTRLGPQIISAQRGCQYDAVEAELRAKAEKLDKDQLVYLLPLFSMAMDRKDYAQAKHLGMRSVDAMWSYEGDGKGKASLVSSEAIKIFKGEPFEKVMASTYLGIALYKLGDVDNARASFLRATQATRLVENKDGRKFALPFVLLSFWEFHHGDRDNAEILFKQAHEALGKPSWFTESLLRDHKDLILVQSGLGPRKVRTGPGKSLATWQKGGGPQLRGVRWSGNGQTAYQIADLHHEAVKKKRTGKDKVQMAKGIARDAALATSIIALSEANERQKRGQDSGAATAVALGAGLFALLNQSQADIRQWETLPGRIDALFLNLPKGAHTLRFTFQESVGVGGYGKSMVAVTDEKPSMHLVDDIPCSASSPAAVSGPRAALEHRAGALTSKTHRQF